MKKYKLDARLSAAAGFARMGKVAADVGTDHAMLPIYLVSEGIAPRAVASDINPGPLARAKLNISDAGLSDKIEAVLTDGLDGLEDSGAEDIFILGMGGELISRIVLSSDLPRSPGVRLVMQPMTHAQDLRRDLGAAGFTVIDEALSEDCSGRIGNGDGRIYQTIAAEYTGATEEYFPEELVLGRINIARGGELLKKYAAYLAQVYSVRAAGLEKAGRDASYEKDLILRLGKIR